MMKKIVLYLKYFCLTIIVAFAGQIELSKTSFDFENLALNRPVKSSKIARRSSLAPAAVAKRNQDLRSLIKLTSNDSVL